MKNTIIVTTDFSYSAANALNYASEFVKNTKFKILLVHIYSIPAGYSGEGLSVATINDSLTFEQSLLSDELKRVRSNYDYIEIESRMVTGEFIGSLEDLNKELDPEMIIIGAYSEYSELRLWEDKWLNALTALVCPVLVIPRYVTYTPITQIGFACDYLKAFSPGQISSVKNLAGLAGANLHIVHVTNKSSKINHINMAAVQDTFKETGPQYHLVENVSVIEGMADFVKQYEIDLLIVIPRKYGFWQSLFHKSNTKQLAQLNSIPVMAIHEDY